MKPKILFADIETRPVRFHGWRTGKTVLSHSQIVEGDKFDIICIAYKWEGAKKTHILHWGLEEQNSENMIQEFGKVVEDADVVIGHNWDAFDKKQINTQRLMHSLPPISWPTSEDTLKLMRRQFYFTSFKLDYLAKTLLGVGKNPMTLQDWLDVTYKKCPKAFNKMLKYCKKDVEILESVWKKVYTHLDIPANRSLIMHGHKAACPYCGSFHTISKGYRTTKSGRYQRLQCESCGGSFKDPRMEKQAKIEV